MGVGKCKACESDDVTVSMFGGGALIFCHSCGLKASGASLEEAERHWENIQIVHVESERGKALTAMHLLTTATLPLALGFGPDDSPLARFARKKEPKQMGPGAGTSRQRRAKEGKPW